VIGAVAIVVLTAYFPQQRIGFLLTLALWAAACGFLATLQKRNALNNRPAEINPGRA
jgi:uncharacterized membrane protein YccC